MTVPTLVESPNLPTQAIKRQEVIWEAALKSLHAELNYYALTSLHCTPSFGVNVAGLWEQEYDRLVILQWKIISTIVYGYLDR
jgi:hypothetical protein